MFRPQEMMLTAGRTAPRNASVVAVADPWCAAFRMRLHPSKNAACYRIS